MPRGIFRRQARYMAATWPGTGKVLGNYGMYIPPGSYRDGPFLKRSDFLVFYYFFPHSKRPEFIIYYILRDMVDIVTDGFYGDTYY